MKATRIYTLLAFLIAVGIASLKAQQPYDLEEVFVTDEATPVYAQYINTEEMIVFTTNTDMKSTINHISFFLINAK